MDLAFILAVLAALIIPENAPREPVEGTGWRLAAAFAAMMLVGAFAAVCSGATVQRLRAGCRPPGELLRRFGRLRRVHVILWLAAAVAISYGLRWGQVVRFNLHLDHLPLVDDLAILVPVVLPMVLSWAAFYDVDRAVRLRGVAAGGAVLPTRRRYVGLHLRHYLGTLLLPIFMLLAFQDLIERAVPGLFDTRFGPALYAVPLVVLFLFFPFMIRAAWVTRPLPDGELRQRLLRLAGQCGFRVREIVVWETGGLLANAAVAGFAARFRYVFLTDALVDHFHAAEIEAAFAHEMGHVRHRHLSWRGLAMLLPVSLGLGVSLAAPGVAPTIHHWLADGVARQLPLSQGALAGLALYGVFAFGRYSRWLEVQADLFSCRALEAAGNPEAFATTIGALEKLAAANGADRRRATWQHASIARRVAFLRRAAEDPAWERRFHRAIRLANTLLATAASGPWIYLLLRTGLRLLR